MSVSAERRQSMTIDVIIPVYRPGAKFFKLLEMLTVQTVLPKKIIIADTVGDGENCDELRAEVEKALGDSGIEADVFPVNRSEYDHALTRQKGVERSNADAFLLMTQDAVPYDNILIEKLSEALENGAEAAFARQIANGNADIIEKYTRVFNYPGTSRVRKAEDFEKFGIKTIFCSDTCMMYDRKTFDKLGGHGEKSIFAEDMTYAYKLLEQGGSLAYVSEAQVFHSHDYKLKANFRRSYALGVNQSDHPEIYKNLSSEKEGKKYVRYVVRRIARHGRIRRIPYFLITCCAKYTGVLMGRHWRVFGRKRAIRITGNRNYFA